MKYSTDTQVAEKSGLELDRLIQNPLVREIKAILDQIRSFKERAKEFYFEVLLSSVRCPGCNGRLNMIAQSKCACSCGNVLDPTVEFQKSTCCGAKLVRKTFHYSCSKCQRGVPSRFLFDEKLFDGEYFRVMMQESRRRSQRKKEEIRRLLAESRSGALTLLEDPNLESIPGLLKDLHGFINDGSNAIEGFHFDLETSFEMGKYREHILSNLGWNSTQFSDIDPVIDDYRKDKIWRFVTLVFMQHDREVLISKAMNFSSRGITMKLTLKDKDFLERLRYLFDSKDLDIELKKDGLKRLILCRNYGDKVEAAFNMTRQGVRWRFQRLFNEIYVSSYESIYMIESLFGADLRQKAIEIAKERVALRKKAQKSGNLEGYRLKTASK